MRHAASNRPLRSTAHALWCLLALALLPPAVIADQVCGEGTFQVVLPNLNGHPNDTLDLPKGCRMYALFVSGYERNKNLDELSFYKLAKFVMENDGYVHWAWWNNLLKEYMGRPLHPEDTFTLPPFGPVFDPSPGGLVGVHALGFVPLAHEFDLVPKAVPEEDVQFQADAERMLQAIREHNPDAVIIVAGHSMGGNAVARLGANTNVDIDLLAPIDPVGNRSSPTGRPTLLDPRADRTFNWTRWRATREFRGFRIRDCVRNAIGLCANFGTFFQPQFRCRNIGPLLSSPPPFPGSLAPILCPGPWVDPGIALNFGGNVKRLYHRWQKETLFPFDFLTDEYYGHWAPRNAGSLVEARNWQRPVPQNSLGELDPDKTCWNPVEADPRDGLRLCNPTDGHGEIVGFRFPTPGQVNPPGPNVPVAPLALQARNWPALQDASQRRARIIDMRYADDSWAHRPVNPDLCLVSDDMVAIATQLLIEETEASVAPVTMATSIPAANEHGWHNEDVLVTLTATAAAGREITGIEYSLSGAQQDAMIEAGDHAEILVSKEGDTTITYFARDNGGNVEEARELTIRLDKTPPHITAIVSPDANVHGWHTEDVSITFIAQDLLSGVDTVDPPVMITNEGAGQEVTGIATDLAGNTGAIVVEINLDKTPPKIIGLPDVDCSLWPPNNQMVHVATVSTHDAHAGGEPESLAIAVTSSEPETGTGNGRHSPDILISGQEIHLRAERSGKGQEARVYTLTVSVDDIAGNGATETVTCSVPHDQRSAQAAGATSRQARGR